MTVKLALGATLLLATSACGSDSKTASPAATDAAKTTEVAATTPATEAATTPATDGGDETETTEETVSDDTVSGGSVDPANAPGAGSDFCNAVIATRDASNEVDPLFDEASDPQIVKAAIAKFIKELDGLVKVGPADLQPDLVTMQTGFTDFDAALAADDYDIAKAMNDPANEDKLKFMTSTEFGEAGDRIDFYTMQECGTKIGD